MICGVTLRELIACLFMFGGAIFFIGSAIGMLRLPDFYCRIHASGNSETLGTVLSFIGLMILEGPTLTAAKIAFVFLFVFLANPIGSHILSKAAYKTGHPVWTLDSVRESEAAKALNQEHILSEPLGNLDVEPKQGEGTVKIYSGSRSNDAIGETVDIVEAPPVAEKVHRPSAKSNYRAFHNTKKHYHNNHGNHNHGGHNKNKSNKNNKGGK